MIKSISIRNCASYDNTGCDISDLQKINMIYGGNGTGKTTISNFLRNPILSHYKDCNIQWQDSPIDIIVYNKRFREDNFAQGDIKGVFTLGTATQQEIQTIEQKEHERDVIIQEGKKKKQTLENQQDRLKEVEEAFKELVWKNYYKKHENDFSQAFEKYKSKERFKSRLIVIFHNLKNTPPDHTPLLADLQQRAVTLFSDEESVTMPTIPMVSNDQLLAIEREADWQKIIIGRQDVDIANLIQRLNISDWVKQGKHHIEGDTCPFCQQPTITEDFKRQLEDYFDSTYTHEIAHIEQLAENYNRHVEQVISLLERIESNQNTLDDSKLDLTKFRLLKTTIEQRLQSNQQKIIAKQKEPSRKIVLDDCGSLLSEINETIEQANHSIKELNQIVDNFETEKKKLIKEFWQFLLAEAKNDVAEFIKQRDGLQHGIDNLEREIKQKRSRYAELNTEIIDLQNNLTDIQPTINNINHLLKAYGFNGFYLVKSERDGFYQIRRQDGTLAHHTLSEGEITFITFLYFLQLINGATSKNDISNHRVVVIDDPISSLDSNVLFIVSALTKSLIKDIWEDKTNVKQLIILTHNVYFHKEVTFFPRDNKSMGFWFLRKRQGVSRVECCDDNPIQSSYALLWQELKRTDTASVVSTQNIMRRILENYFQFMGGYDINKLSNYFEDIEEKRVCQSLLSWINEGSHSIHDDLEVEHPIATVDIYKEVFKKIFEVSRHQEHYKMMTQT